MDLRNDLTSVIAVQPGNRVWGNDFCMLLAYSRVCSQLVTLPSCPLPVPVGIILFISGVLGSCCLFISHCFQAWTALFWGVPYLSAECQWLAPVRLPAPPETPTLTRTFFFSSPHPPQAPGVMKTKYAHLPMLSVAYPTLFFTLSIFFILPSLLSWHLGQWELRVCPVVVRRDSQ